MKSFSKVHPAKTKIICIFAVVLVLVGMISCSHNSVSSHSESNYPTDSTDLPEPITINIDFDDASPFSDILISQIIEFDDSVDDYPGSIVCMAVSGDTIVVCDNYKAPGIYLYNHEGNLLGCYTSRGIGPDDFMRLVELQLTDSEISAFDDAAGQIIILDRHCNFLRKEKVSDYAVSAFLGDDGDMYVDFSNFEISDMKLGRRPRGGRPDSLISILEIPDFQRGIRFGSLNEFQRIGEHIYTYTPGLDNKIYTVQGNSIKPRYIMDFGSYWWSENEFRNIARRNDWPRKIMKFPIQIMKSRETEKYLMLYIRKEQTDYLYLFDKNTTRGKLFKENNMRTFVAFAVSDSLIYQISDSVAIEVRKIPTI